MSTSFPISPLNGDHVNLNGRRWRYDGTSNSWGALLVDEPEVAIVNAVEPADAVDGGIWYNPISRVMHVFVDGFWMPLGLSTYPPTSAISNPGGETYTNLEGGYYTDSIVRVVTWDEVADKPETLVLTSVPASARGDLNRLSISGITQNSVALVVPNLTQAGIVEGKPYYNATGVDDFSSGVFTGQFYLYWRPAEGGTPDMWQLSSVAQGHTTFVEIATSAELVEPWLVTLWDGGSNDSAPDTTDATVTRTIVRTTGTASTHLRQAAIVNHTDGSQTAWESVRLSPVRWLPTTAGIIYNRALGHWERMFIGVAAGDTATSIQTELLINQS